MGRFVHGHWQQQSVTASPGSDGAFRRQPTTFRSELGADPFPFEAGRYHLYHSIACPWSHRTAIVRRLKGLEDVLTASSCDPLMLAHGWAFTASWPDPLYGHDLVGALYLAADPDYTGRVTVPFIWDKQQQTIVNNESSEIIRFLNTWGNEGPDLYPEPLRDEIDALNERVYDCVNNGVYRAGFARRQEPYDTAVNELFDTLNDLEQRLQGRSWLVGDQLTEADIRLFVTLVRFDSVYHHHFKCSRARLRDYPNLLRHTQAVYALPGVADTVDLEHIKQHYYRSHETLNPKRIVPQTMPDPLR